MTVARTRLVLGKGGVGKSLIAEGLALAAAKEGSTLLVRIGEKVGGGTGHRRPVVSAHGFDMVDLDPRTAMDDFVEHVVPLRALASRITESDVYRRFFAAAPGLPELVLLGRIRAYAEQGDARSKRRFQTIVVDCPSSGHGLLMLETPYAARRAVPIGPFGRLASQIVEWAETQVDLVAVSIPEEMAVVETVELAEDLKLRTSLRIGKTIMNRLRGDGISARAASALRVIGPGDSPADRLLADCGRLTQRRARLESFHVRRLARGLGLPVISVAEVEPPTPVAIAPMLEDVLT